MIHSVPPSGPDYRARTRRRLQDVVEDASREPPLMTPIEMREIGPNAVAELKVRWRCHPRLAEPDECEMAILQLLYLRGLTRAEKIVDALLGEFPRPTIYRRLQRLVRLKVIRRRRRTPRGYDLDPWMRRREDLGESV